MGFVAHISCSKLFVATFQLNYFDLRTMGNQFSEGLPNYMVDLSSVNKYIELFCPIDDEAMLFGPPRDKLQCKLPTCVRANY